MARDSSTAADWRKSQRSGTDGCVECAAWSGTVRMRDSKDPDGPELIFDHATWRGFIHDLKRGMFDRRASS
jgi:Domain of unknown function (DUF397)